MRTMSKAALNSGGIDPARGLAVGDREEMPALNPARRTESVQALLSWIHRTWLARWLRENGREPGSLDAFLGGAGSFLGARPPRATDLLARRDSPGHERRLALEHEAPLCGLEESIEDQVQDLGVPDKELLSRIASRPD
jgi:hypothetical protein